MKDKKTGSANQILTRVKEGDLALLSPAPRFITRPSEPYFSRRDQLDESVGLATSQISHNGFSVGCYRRDRPNLGLSVPSPLLDLFMVVVTLRPLLPVEQWQDGRSIGASSLEVGSLAWLDFRNQWVTDLKHPFHTVNFFLPISAFDELSRDLRQPSVAQSSIAFKYVPHDTTMLHIAKALIPLLAKSEQASVLFVDHLLSSVVTYLATTYGGLETSSEPASKGLAIWQKSRAIDIMLNDLGEDVTTSSLSNACGLSKRQFERAFRASMGQTPHRWRTGRRIDKAARLLRSTTLSLTNIAVECGFADQSHLTRVFSRATGETPAAYRRLRRT